MISIRRVITIAYILVTIASISLVSYNVYLVFGAYDVARLLNVSISNIDVTRLSGKASLKLNFLFGNPSKFAIELVYAAAFVYLNGKALTLSYAPATLIRYSNPIQLLPSSIVQVPIELGNVPSDMVPMTSSKHWSIKLQFIVYNVPLTGIGTYTFYLEKEEAGS
jgi:hypothetical protein